MFDVNSAVVVWLQTTDTLSDIFSQSVLLNVRWDEKIDPDHAIIGAWPFRMFELFVMLKATVNDQRSRNPQKLSLDNDIFRKCS